MNPGYAGRTELPENLKALFRPCAMVVPDFALICEIMLVAEGFQEARLLARKFITLYTLCKELLSKQDHYDWGLRAIKSVLVVAGSLKRGDKQRPEDQVLMRALRDFNVPKIVIEDQRRIYSKNCSTQRTFCSKTLCIHYRIRWNWQIYGLEMSNQNLCKYETKTIL